MIMKTEKSNILLTVALLLVFFNVTGQELLQLLEKESNKMPMYTQATFKTNRVVVSQSVETRKKGTLEFILGTRYWNIPGNDNSQSFGADRFSGHLGIQYAFSDRFTAGGGASSADGIFNSFLKYRLVRQRQDKNVPFGITLVQGASYHTRNTGVFILPEATPERWSYVSQAIIARKFDSKFSLQVSPTFLRINSEQPIDGERNLFLMGFGGRYKLNNHLSLTSEYGMLFNRTAGEQGFDLFALGLNWEIGDLIMQFSLSNTKGFDDVSIYTFNPNNFHFRQGGLHVGVNATYILHLKKRKINQ